MDVNDLRKAATCVFLATDSAVAQDLSDKLNWAANEIGRLEKLIKTQQKDSADSETYQKCDICGRALNYCIHCMAYRDR